AHRDLHAFPTRRSSDLAADAERRLREAYEQEQATRRNQQIEASEQARYVGLIQSAIERRWIEPPNVAPNTQATLRIRLLPTGEWVSVELVRSSGNAAFDRSALSAASAVSRYPVPQGGLFEEFRVFELLFNPKG